MSADFWAGYLSGAIGIVVGNPLDIAKVKMQVGAAATSSAEIQNSTSFLRGTAAPILGYGALNALLFVSYNRSLTALEQVFQTPGSLWSTWAAGATGGLATWAVSTPTELVKCRAQLSVPTQESSFDITRRIWRADGIRGLYFGGVVTALRDSIGYGFYFWSYELASRQWPQPNSDNTSWVRHEAAKVLMCGGIAGVVTWASVFPLDVIKSRVQTQPWGPVEHTPLMQEYGQSARPERRQGAIEVARTALRQEGAGVFFRGLTVCSVRAFVVNAVQWAVYEWMMSKANEDLKSGKSQGLAMG